MPIVNSDLAISKAGYNPDTDPYDVTAAVVKLEAEEPPESWLLTNVSFRGIRESSGGRTGSFMIITSQNHCNCDGQERLLWKQIGALRLRISRGRAWAISHLVGFAEKVRGVEPSHHKNRSLMNLERYVKVIRYRNNHSIYIDIYWLCFDNFVLSRLFANKIVQAQYIAVLLIGTKWEVWRTLGNAKVAMRTPSSTMRKCSRTIVLPSQFSGGVLSR